MAEALDAATRCREAALQRVQNAINNINNPEYLDKYNAEALKLRMDSVLEKMADLRKQQRLTMALTVAQADRAALTNELDEIEENYMDAIATMEARIRQLDPPPPVAPQQASAVAADAQPSVVHVNLPETPTDTWGTFSGDKLLWFDWKSKFVLGVHDAAKVSKKDKLRFLGSALKGRAADTIRKFEFVEANYEQMWQALVDEYE